MPRAPRRSALDKAIAEASSALHQEGIVPQRCVNEQTDEFCDDDPSVKKSRNFFFTIWDNSDETWEKLDQLDVRALAAQEEICPTTGKIHIQACCRMPSPRAFKYWHTLFHPVKLWVRRCVDLPKARGYCTKDDTRRPGGRSLVKGDEWTNEQGAPSELRSLVAELTTPGADLRTAILRYPTAFVRSHRGVYELLKYIPVDLNDDRRAVNVRVLYGPTGVGKTHRIHEWIRQAGVQYYKLTSSCAGTNGILWFPGYIDQWVLIIDDFRGDWIPWQHLLAICQDWYGDVRVASDRWVRGVWREVWITSDRHPMYWYCTFDFERMKWIDLLQPRERQQVMDRLQFLEELTGASHRQGEDPFA